MCFIDEMRCFGKEKTRIRKKQSVVALLNSAALPGYTTAFATRLLSEQLMNCCISVPNDIGMVLSTGFFNLPVDSESVDFVHNKR